MERKINRDCPVLSREDQVFCQEFKGMSVTPVGSDLVTRGYGVGLCIYGTALLLHKIVTILNFSSDKVSPAMT